MILIGQTVLLLLGELTARLWREVWNEISCFSGLVAVGEAQEFSGWSTENFSDFNCSIPKIIRGEWYSREKNEDARNNIDSDTMTARGTCKSYRSHISFLTSHILHLKS